MKTRNIVKKSVTTLAALGFTFVLFTHQAGAQMVDKSAGSNDGTTRNVPGSIFIQSAVSYAAEIEARRNSYNRFELVTDAETPMRLERWMVDKRNFVTLAPRNLADETTPVVSNNLENSLESMLVTEKEEPMKLEAWMTDNESFPCKERRPADELFSAILLIK